MTTAINRTVDFAKTASNIALIATMETTSVMDALHWAVNCVASTQARMPIEVMPLPSDICKHVVTDKHWLMENMLCYLSNAAKYSSDGKITVSVTLQDAERSVVEEAYSPPKKEKRLSGNVFVMAMTSSNNDVEDCVDTASQCENEVSQMLCISIEDEGIGINDDLKSYMFQPFQQTMRLAGGTGLGLYSLAKRVEVLRGNYGVTDRSDGRPGSRFWFSIPYVADEIYDLNCLDTSSPQQSLRNKRSSREGFDGVCFTHDQGGKVDECSTRRIDDSTDEITPSSLFALVVEDSLVISKATKRMLSKAGYVVDVAENGAIGLEKMKKRVYSVVVMDLQMPIMDGLEATRQIRSFETEASNVSSGIKKQLIFGVSANGADDIREEALSSGMNTFVPKPFSVNNLMEFQQQSSNLTCKSEEL
jgi:CheY-like chemotaxis protein